jgi:Zn ribbon nucleic-acid-binding protein
MGVPLDGNTMAGALGELFAVDVSVAVIECAGCGHTGVVAEAVVYADAPGMVARCPACSDVLLRLVRSDRRAWLDMSGVVCLRVDI